ncbi:MAG: MFS transporter [Bacteroidetes bacterium]|nr:MAG: MFS transporter [Bacteroidota bacterium]
MGPLKLTLLLISILTIMAASIVAPALPEIARVFGDIPGSDLLSKMVLSLPAIFIALSAPIAGRLIDKHGRLKYLFAALLTYTISGTSAYYLNDIYAILVGRAILGISIGVIMTITITLIGDYFEGEERKKFIGLQSAFIGLSGIIFLASGGFLADISWRTPFLIYLFPLILIPLTAKYLVEPNRVSQTSEAGDFKVGTILKIVFATATSYMILFYIVPTQLPFLLKEMGFNANSLTGTILSLNALGMVISALLYSRIKSKFSFPVVLSFGLILMATGFVLISFVNTFLFVVMAMIINGFGIGLLMPNINLWAIELTQPAQRGKSLGILTMCLFLGQFLSPIIMQPAVKAFGLTELFFGVGMVLMVMAATFLVFRRRLAG